jgi:hypothetical protein
MAPSSDGSHGGPWIATSPFGLLAMTTIERRWSEHFLANQMWLLYISLYQK